VTEASSAVAPIVPAPSVLTAFFRDGARRGTLLIQQCTSCGKYQHPPEPICHHCLSVDLGHGEVSGRGTVSSYAIAVQAFHPYSTDKIQLRGTAGERALSSRPSVGVVSNAVGGFAASALLSAE
jgi:hypothetical protein